MKQYIKPNIEMMNVRSCTLLDSSFPEPEQINGGTVKDGESIFMGKGYNDWGFDEYTNKWPKSHSLWD